VKKMKKKGGLGGFTQCLADPTKREACIEDILNRLLVQERTLSHSLQVSFPQGQIQEGIKQVSKVRDNLRFLARDLGYKGYF